MAEIQKEDLGVLKPDALGPADTEAKGETVAVGKATMPKGKAFVSAMLAGAFIAFGGMYFVTFLGDPNMPFAVQRIVGGLCFCLGLVLVLVCGAELFTGNSLMVMANASHKISGGQLIGSWVLVWLGNLAGALVAVFVIYMSNIQAMNAGAVGAAFVSVAHGKVALSPVQMIFKGIMCNVLVCLTVWGGFSARTVADKVLYTLLPISAFVACGFEHCVANMFFLPMGLALNMAGYGAAGAVTLGGVCMNELFVTIGNIIGGALIGYAYWFIYHKKHATK